MAADFEPEDKYSWYFGPLSREETNDILQKSPESGVFLVRDSQSIRGDFVLCVKEDNKVSHYIINRIQSLGTGTAKFKIGDKEFNDIPSLLNFYKSHYLDTTTLIKPAPREKLAGKYDFPGRDPEDLPFRKGDILEVISKDEEEWWTARDKNGRVGQIPVKYTMKISQSNGASSPKPVSVPVCSHSSHSSGDARGIQNDVQVYKEPEPVRNQIKLPALARVITDRNPNAYDPTQLKLKKGDVVKVLSMNVSGQWEGEVGGRRGIFPFTHVQFINDDDSAA